MSTIGVGEEFDWYVGIDWGSAEHQVEIGNATGAGVEQRQVAHTAEGLEGFVEALAQLAGGPLERVAVGIEVPRGAVVELLLERGAAVFSINPKQLDRCRDRFSVAGAKDDRLDARVLRSTLRTDRHLFRRVRIDEPLVIRVRELTRARDVLQQEFMGLTNRLRDLVHRIAPEWLTLSTNADDPWFWMFLEEAATPTLGRRLRRRKIQGILTTYHIRRVRADDVLAVLAKPPIHIAPGTLEAVTQHMQLVLPRVRLVHEQQRRCERELEVVLKELAAAPPAPPDSGAAATGPEASSTAGPSDVTLLRSITGVGLNVAAAFIAEASPVLQLQDYATLRALTGVAPVRRQTGKNKRGLITMRYACNGRLRNACYHWARVSIQVDAAARAYYAALRARGHSHGRSLRSVADRWLRILVAMLKSRTPYDPARFTSAVAAT
jgi:transposase